MTKSTVTSKYQTTIPKEIRQKLGLGPQDVLQWEVVGDEIRVVPSHNEFLRRRGSVTVGAGSPVEDVQRARKMRGTEEP
jgi:AbrB family looped-hinge helix DNA binding protein